MSDSLLESFGEDLKVVVFGATGGIGGAFVSLLEQQKNIHEIYAVSRSAKNFSSAKTHSFSIDFKDEVQLQNLAETIGEVDIVVVATGLLHKDSIKPEKSLKDINLDNFSEIFSVNTFLPALIAKYFVPKLKRDKKVAFAALSARVGSISDNQLGGWYAYRASKAALNMILKNTSIEAQRKNAQACIIGLHPGTVETDLSHPFHGGISPDKIFTPAFSAQKLIGVLNQVNPEESGHTFAWDGEKIPF